MPARPACHSAPRALPGSARAVHREGIPCPGAGRQGPGRNVERAKGSAAYRRQAGAAASGATAAGLNRYKPTQDAPSLSASRRVESCSIGVSAPDGRGRVPSLRPVTVASALCPARAPPHRGPRRPPPPVGACSRVRRSCLRHRPVHCPPACHHDFLSAHHLRKPLSSIRYGSSSVLIGHLVSALPSTGHACCALRGRHTREGNVIRTTARGQWPAAAVAPG